MKTVKLTVVRQYENMIIPITSEVNSNPIATQVEQFMREGERCSD